MADQINNDRRTNLPKPETFPTWDPNLRGRQVEDPLGGYFKTTENRDPKKSEVIKTEREK